MKPMNLDFSKSKKVFLVIGLIIGILVIFNSATYSVQYGTVGLLTRFGKIIGEAKDPGLHLKFPLVDKVVVYRTQKIVYETLANDTLYNSTNADYMDVSVDTNTKDGQQVSIRYTIRFYIVPDKIKDVAEKLGTESEVVEKIVKTDSRIWVRQIPRSYSANELYTGNIDVVADEITEKLVPIFEENGLVLDEFGIRAIQFADAYINAIEQKQIEAEKVKTEEFIAQQEEFKKKALITKAEGESEAQKLQEKTLTNNLIKKLYIEKWNGILPNIMTDGSSLLIDIKE